MLSTIVFLLTVWSNFMYGENFPQNPVRPPWVIVTDETWEVSAEPTDFGEYPLSAEQIAGPGTRLKGGSQKPVRAAFYRPSQILAGTMPIWTQAKAGEDWEARQFRKTVKLDHQPIRSVIMQINCDDAARVYINQRLVNPEDRDGRFNDAGGRESLFRDLTAFLYSEVKTYDVTDYFFTGVTNTILVEVANQPIGDNHAYLSASFTIEFVPETPRKAAVPAKPPRPAVAVTPETATTRIQKATVSAPASGTENTAFNSKSTIAVEKLRIGAILKLENVYFKEDDFKLDSASYQTLSALITFLKANPSLKIEVGGHTNLRPDVSFAKRLSENRARAVATYLTDNGVGMDRITYKGYGKTAPKASGTSASANRQNQRVEVKIMKI